MICGNKFVSPLEAFQTIFILKNIYIYTKQLKYKEITISNLLPTEYHSWLASLNETSFVLYESMTYG